MNSSANRSMSRGLRRIAAPLALAVAIGFTFGRSGADEQFAYICLGAWPCKGTYKDGIIYGQPGEKLCKCTINEGLGQYIRECIQMQLWSCVTDGTSTSFCDGNCKDFPELACGVLFVQCNPNDS